jgi:DNA-nicking Smr family endonuclease
MSDDDLSEEDKALFRSQMRLVKPLKTTPLSSQKPLRIIPSRPTKTRVIKQTRDIPLHTLSDFIRETVLSNTILSFKRQNLSDKRFKELAAGKIPWQAKLDLHRKTIEEASQCLSIFIHQCQANQLRSVLIIHGKGEKNNNPPVLKNQVNAWLPQLDEVLAFHSALPKDGGTGAVYVFLTRIRE